MSISTLAPSHPLDATVIIDLDDPPTGHRLSELVQALTGCSIEHAEMAVSDPTPTGPASVEDALEATARALVRLRPRPPV